jgi:Galactose mutarotase and related enzymes
MGISERLYGKTKEGQEVFIYTLSNSKGMKVEILNYGGIIVSIYAPDRKGKFEDIALGFDNLEDYLVNPPYFGAVIGRHANRIEDGQFELNGKVYKLAINDGSNHLHGGIKGFDKVVWDSEIINRGSVESLMLSYKSIDGEEGYPGNLDVRIYYTLSESNEIIIEYHAVTDKDTVVNLTNHSYFNLCGHAAGNVSNHKVMINADRFTVIDERCTPNGDTRDVTDTPMDLRNLTILSKGFSSDYEQLIKGNGFDHNWILNAAGDLSIKSAEVYEETTGRIMEVYTSKPGVQLYTGNFLDGSLFGKGGAVYANRGGLCLETQFFPNSMKHKNFPSPILRKGEEYNYTTIYKFNAR